MRLVLPPPPRRSLPALELASPLVAVCLLAWVVRLLVLEARHLLVGLDSLLVVSLVARLRDSLDVEDLQDPVSLRLPLALGTDLAVLT